MSRDAGPELLHEVPLKATRCLSWLAPCQVRNESRRHWKSLENCHFFELPRTVMLIKENTGDVPDTLHERVSRVEIYFKLVLIFREFLAVVVKPMLKQLLSARVTWSSVLLKNLQWGWEWPDQLSRAACRLGHLKKQSSFLLPSLTSAFFCCLGGFF